jgi:hypothetical protein
MSSMSEITVAFSQLVEAMQRHRRSAFVSAEGTAPYEWFEPTDPALLDLRKPATIADAFARDQVADLLAKILTQTSGSSAKGSVPQGTAMDLAVIHAQLEFLQAAERCYTSATLDPCRAAAHASARYEAHSVDGGVLDRGISAYVADLKKRAAGASA